MASVGCRTLPVMADNRFLRKDECFLFSGGSTHFLDECRLFSVISIRDVAHAIVSKDRELAVLQTGDPSLIEIPPPPPPPPRDQKKSKEPKK